MNLNKLILKAINEGIEKSLLQFDDEIEFNKSNNSIQSNQQRIKNQLYDFVNCIYGDKVYYDRELGYNLITGEYYGFCCIEKGQIDDKPRFVYKEDIGKMSWGNAIEKCQEMPNGYLPNIDELQLAYDNGLKNELIQQDYYWSSTQYENDSYYAYNLNHYSYFSYNGKDADSLVRPFFRIPKLENKLHESFDFNKKLLSFDDEIEFNKSKSDSVKKNVSNDLAYIKFVDDNFVDLGLPSGTLWMKYNLGAACGDTKESWYGDYYAWGELKTKEKYSEKNYTYKQNSKVLLLSNDIVYQTYSKQFHNQKTPIMPTHEQIKELTKYTKTEWTENFNGIEGLNGRIFTSKTNGNILFIPAAGYCNDSGLNYVDRGCYLWSSSLYPSISDTAWRFSFDSNGITSNYAGYCYDGFSVRGILTLN